MVESDVVYLAPMAGRGRVLIPAGVRRVPGGLWMSSACRPAGLVAAWLLGTSTRSSVRLLSTRAQAPPLPGIDWAKWAKDWLPAGAAPPSRWIIGLPGDRRRKRFQLLIPDRAGEALAFAKFTVNPSSDHAIRARSRLDEMEPQVFWTPRLIGHGEHDGWWFTVDEAMPGGFHRPARLSPRGRQEMTDEIQGILAEVMAPPQDMVAIHGDFGPWNVRSARRGLTVVLDWEEVTTGPAAADELWHALNTTLLRTRLGPTVATVARQLTGRTPDEVSTAARFWLDRLAQPEPAEVTESTEVNPSDTRLLRLQRSTLEALSRG